MIDGSIVKFLAKRVPNYHVLTPSSRGRAKPSLCARSASSAPRDARREGLCAATTARSRP